MSELWERDCGTPAAEILGLIRAAFGSAEHLWPADLRWATRQDGRLVGHVAAQCRWFIVNGSYLRGWFIGGMCTHPDLQGRGIGSALLDIALSDLRGRDLDFAVLNCGSQKADFYERRGFRKTSESGVYFRDGQAVVDEGDPAMAIALSPGFDLDALTCEAFPFGFDF